MNKDTPRRKQRREKLAKKFSDDWEADTEKGPTIRYKKKKGIAGVFPFFFRRKHSVFAMYWFFKKSYLKDMELRKFDFPIKHDNIPTPGVPFKYELKGSWQIDDKDLKYLYGGPLIDQYGDLLVSTETLLKVVWRFTTNATSIIIALLSIAIMIFIDIPQLLALL